MKKQLKPFNLKEALQGNVEVLTKSGYKVKDMYLFEDTNNLFSLVCLLERKEGEDVGDFIHQYTKDGKFLWGQLHENDLIMYDKVAVCYVNVYKMSDGRLHLGGTCRTKELALGSICAPQGYQYLKTIEITEQTSEDVSNDDDTYNELGQNDIDGLMRYVIKNLVN
jgi:hypothetical protein